MGAWWQDRERLARYMADLLRGELARARRSAEALPRGPWPESFRIDADLGADSLERMALATALSETIQLHRSGVEDALLARRQFGEWLDTAVAGLALHDGEITFRSSGSTGVPRSCTHTLEGLSQEVAALASRLGEARRIVRVVPCHHIYGFLFTVLLPERLGLPDDHVIDARSASPASVAQRVQRGDLVIGYPDFWRDFARIRHLPAGVAGVTSTAPCPEEVACDVIASGIAPFLEVYGASETAGVGWRTEPSQPFELMPHWRRAGEWLVRERADGSAFSTRPPDDLEWRGPRHFKVLGRKDGAVQVGGVNVWPAQVRNVLLDHPGVSDAVVRPMGVAEGNRLKAFIVPTGTQKDLARLERELRAWIDERLEPPQRPKALQFGSSLPTTATGKPADWRLDG
jgi:long-chain acyl-CoA synthetase